MRDGRPRIEEESRSYIGDASLVVQQQAACLGRAVLAPGSKQQTRAVLVVGCIDIGSRIEKYLHHLDVALPRRLRSRPRQRWRTQPMSLSRYLSRCVSRVQASRPCLVSSRRRWDRLGAPEATVQDGGRVSESARGRGREVARSAIAPGQLRCGWFVPPSATAHAWRRWH